jgi:hypothetical protein
MSRYDINFASLARLLLPTVMRLSVRMGNFLRAIVKPLQTLNAQFNLIRTRTDYQVLFDSRIIYLEKLLNDFFDNLLRRIYIGDGALVPRPDFIYNIVENRPPIFIYNLSEGQPPTYMRNQAESINSLDFIVYVPTAILTPQSEQQIRAWVNQYRISGKRFQVQGF